MTHLKKRLREKFRVQAARASKIGGVRTASICMPLIVQCFKTCCLSSSTVISVARYFLSTGGASRCPTRDFPKELIELTQWQRKDRQLNVSSFEGKFEELMLLQDGSCMRSLKSSIPSRPPSVALDF